MKTIAVLMVLILSGCSLSQTKPEEKETVTVVKEVKVPVREKCSVTIPKPPIWLTEVIDRATSTDLLKSQTILAELEQVRSYLQQVIAEAKKCE